MTGAARARRATEALIAIHEDDPTASVNLYVTSGAEGTHVSATIHRKPGGNWTMPDGSFKLQTAESGRRTLVQTTGSGYTDIEWIEFFPLG